MAFGANLGRSLVLAGVLTFAAVPLASGMAYAAPPATHAPAASHHTKSAHHKSTTLTTRLPKVHIRSRSKLSKGSKIVATLPASGTQVAVRCYKTGTSVGGDATWYRTTAPRAGFVAGRELNISKEPAAGVSACKPKKK